MILWFQCEPIEHTWDPSVKGTCINQVAYFYGTFCLLIPMVVFCINFCTCSKRSDQCSHRLVDLRTAHPVSIQYQETAAGAHPSCTIIWMQYTYFHRCVSSVSYSLGSEDWRLIQVRNIRMYTIDVVAYAADPTWAGYGITIWSHVECSIAVLCGSAPGMFIRCLPHMPVLISAIPETIEFANSKPALRTLFIRRGSTEPRAEDIEFSKSFYDLNRGMCVTVVRSFMVPENISPAQNLSSDKVKFGDSEMGKAGSISDNGSSGFGVKEGL